ncbi:VOC family protein [Phyllobacterium endophyticum]|uniref:VOC family protein n=1 Tax=Phyllobacterium endophyticum TaxID=1149773 RepID=A0A2P7APX7_9HYPH|nr:VOC family protein [Phyllobacterium endophyticum]PSH56272.1 VOC family protein [Phyllobacterium endophyticum]TYR42773.1 VOC family protein [Phyllobacterium endophyticum]
MELKRGRLIDHLHLHSSDLAASKRFYEAVLRVLGIQITDGGEYFFADELWVDSGKSATSVHFAFQAADRETVERFYEAGLKAGGRDNGPPGERHYHPGYYAAFLLDPDGNNVEAVYHGPANKSADFIQITW